MQRRGLWQDDRIRMVENVVHNKKNIYIMRRLTGVMEVFGNLFILFRKKVEERNSGKMLIL